MVSMLPLFRLTPMNLRRKIFFCLFALIVFTQSSCLTDLRTSYMKNIGYNAKEAEELGRIWIDTMVISHQANSLDAWPSYTLSFSDEFFGIKGMFGNPFNEKKTDMHLHFIPNTFDGRLDMNDGRSWVLQSWKAFKKKTGQEFVSVRSNKIRFWLPTFQYFFELPNRISKADIVRYAGEDYFEGRLHEKIFVSWGSEKPHSNADQYILWIDVDTGRLSAAEFTIRDQKFTPKAIAIYRDYTFSGDYLMPQRIEVKLKQKQQNPLHEMRIYDLQIGFKDISYIRIKDNLEVIGDAKL